MEKWQSFGAPVMAQMDGDIVKIGGYSVQQQPGGGGATVVFYPAPGGPHGFYSIPLKRAVAANLAELLTQALEGGETTSADVMRASFERHRTTAASWVPPAWAHALEERVTQLGARVALLELEAEPAPAPPAPDAAIGRAAWGALLAACKDALAATIGGHSTCQYCDVALPLGQAHDAACWVPGVQAAVAKAEGGAHSL